MTERAKRVNGTGTFQSAVNSVEKELNKLQKELQSRGRSLERQLTKSRKQIEQRWDAGVKDLEKQRKQIEKRGRKQIDGIVGQLRKNPVVKRAESLTKDASKQIETLRKDATKQFGSAMETVLGTLQVATKADVKKVDRKLRKLNKKLEELERAKAEPRRVPSQQAASL